MNISTPELTEAARWLGFCHARLPAATAMVDDLWTRRFLEQVAHKSHTTGYCARFYRFLDGSQLTLSHSVEMVS